MTRNLRRLFASAAVSLPLAAILVLQGCDSPTAPRFPPPLEEEEDDTMDEEGVRGLRPTHLSKDRLPNGQLVRSPFLACSESSRCD